MLSIIQFIEVILKFSQRHDLVEIQDDYLLLSLPILVDPTLRLSVLLLISVGASGIHIQDVILLRVHHHLLDLEWGEGALSFVGGHGGTRIARGLL